jgi:hypothetical protein
MVRTELTRALAKMLIKGFIGDKLSMQIKGISNDKYVLSCDTTLLES